MAKEFDVEKAVAHYRRVMKLRDLAKSVADYERLNGEAHRMREAWRRCTGDEDLFELAFCEPFDEHGNDTA